MKNKFRTFLMAAGVLAAVTSVSSVMAYFTDTDEKVNHFTVGRVEIELQEPEWDKNPDENDNGVPDEAENMTPMKTVTKDPKVKNTGDNDAFIFLTVEKPCRDVITVNPDGTRNPSGMTELYTYEKNKNWIYLGSCLVKDGAGKQTGKKYLYAYGEESGECTAVKPGETTSTLFDAITLVNLMEGQGVENKAYDIPVQAYAIQTSDLEGGTKDARQIWQIITNQKELTERYQA